MFEFEGLAKILYDKTNEGKQRFFSVKMPNKNYEVYVEFDSHRRDFQIIQRVRNAAYRNYFTVNSEGEVTSFFDFIPMKSLKETAENGANLPKFTKAFDFKFASPQDPKLLAQQTATQIIEEVMQFGDLPENLKNNIDGRERY